MRVSSQTWASSNMVTWGTLQDFRFYDGLAVASYTIMIWRLSLESSPVTGMMSKLVRTVVLNIFMNAFPFVASEGRCQDLESRLEEGCSVRNGPPSRLGACLGRLFVIGYICDALGQICYSIPPGCVLGQQQLQYFRLRKIIFLLRLADHSSHRQIRDVVGWRTWFGGSRKSSHPGG